MSTNRATDLLLIVGELKGTVEEMKTATTGCKQSNQKVFQNFDDKIDEITKSLEKYKEENESSLKGLLKKIDQNTLISIALLIFCFFLALGDPEAYAFLKKITDIFLK